MKRLILLLVCLLPVLAWGQYLGGALAAKGAAIMPPPAGAEPSCVTLQNNWPTNTVTTDLIHKYTLTYFWASNTFDCCAASLLIKNNPEAANTNTYRFVISAYVPVIELPSSALGYSAWYSVSDVPEEPLTWVTNALLSPVSLTSGTEYVLVLEYGFETRYSGSDYLIWGYGDAQVGPSRFRYSDDGTNTSAIGTFTANFKLFSQ